MKQRARQHLSCCQIEFCTINHSVNNQVLRIWHMECLMNEWLPNDNRTLSDRPTNKWLNHFYSFASFGSACKRTSLQRSSPKPTENVLLLTVFSSLFWHGWKIPFDWAQLNLSSYNPKNVNGKNLCHLIDQSFCCAVKFMLPCNMCT